MIRSATLFKTSDKQLQPNLEVLSFLNLDQKRTNLVFFEVEVEVEVVGCRVVAVYVLPGLLRRNRQHGGGIKRS